MDNVYTIMVDVYKKWRYLKINLILTVSYNESVCNIEIIIPTKTIIKVFNCQRN